MKIAPIDREREKKIFFLFFRNEKEEEERKKKHSDRLDCNESDVCVSPLRFFFFFVQSVIVDFFNCEQYIRALFTVP